MNTQYKKAAKNCLLNARGKTAKKEEPQLRVCVSRLSTGADVHNGFDYKVLKYRQNTHCLQSAHW